VGASDERVFFAGARACDRDDWPAQAQALARLRARAIEEIARGDSGSAERAQGLASALEGYGLWRHGEGERAVALLEDARHLVTGLYDPGEAPPEIAVLRIWLGRLLVELGRPEEALPYFESFWLEPIASFYRGTIQAAAGRTGVARRELEIFLRAWKDADPEMEPLVSRAREELAALPAETAP
jgi:hypothetical protein